MANRAPEAGGGNVEFRPVLRVVLESMIDGPERTDYVVGTKERNDEKIDLGPYLGDYYYGVFCHDVTPAELGQGAWRRGSPRRVSKTDRGLKIGDQEFLPRSEDVFVQSDGHRLVVFNRNDEGEVVSFTYSTSPDTFERESSKFPYPGG